MPSRVQCPPETDTLRYWNPHSRYGHSPVMVPSTEMETLDWSFYPSTAVPCPGPSEYQYNPEPWLDNVTDTPSLCGSTQDSLWDCPSTDHTALNTPTSTCPHNFNVQDTDDLKIMFSTSPQAQLHYNELPGPQASKAYPQYLPGHAEFLKRRRRESEPTTDADIPLPEKATRTLSPQNLRGRFEPSPDPEADFAVEYPIGNDLDIPNGDETDGESGANSEPYAQLIYRALKSAPNHSMVLKEIYEWFEQNTDKAKIAPTSSAKGWQNSIRHNLSMNGAFNKVEQIPPSDESKKGFIWVLAKSALEEGVKSTTRYRKQNSNKKSLKTDHPAPQRQLSGAKGGKAAKKSAANASKMAASKLRRSVRSGRLSSPFHDSPLVVSPQAPVMEDYEESQYPHPHPHPHQHRIPYRPGDTPYYHHTPTSTPLSMVSAPRTFDYGDIVGCTPDMEGPLFYDDPMIDNDGTMLPNHGLPNVDESFLDCHFDDVPSQ